MTVLATSMPVTLAREKAVDENLGSNFARVLCICYSINFGKKSVSALLNSGSELNTINPAFAKELGLAIRPTDVGAQRLNGNTLEIYGMVVLAFWLENKANRVRFFEQTFLVANVSPEVVLGMAFLILRGADVDFLGRVLRWRTYTIKKALPTTRRIKLVGKKEFAAAALDLEHETYVVYVRLVGYNTLPSFFTLELNVHPFHRSQVFSLIAKKAPTKISFKYSDFADLFFPDWVSKPREYTRINDHIIKLIDGCQKPPYGPIYSLGRMELETLKAYIETNLTNGFIRPSKFPAGAPIIFDRKSDGSPWLCANYRGFNNLMIKNWYALPLIGKLLDRLRRAK